MEDNTSSREPCIKPNYVRFIKKSRSKNVTVRVE